MMLVKMLHRNLSHIGDIKMFLSQMTKKTMPKAVKTDGGKQGCLRVPKSGGRLFYIN